MMARFQVSSPSSWIQAFALSAVVGIVLHVLGTLLASKPLKTVGVMLSAPLLVGAVLALVIGLPIAIWTRRKEARK